MVAKKKKIKKATGVFADRCAPIRQHIKQVERELAGLQELLGDEGLTKLQRAEVRRKIAKLKSFLSALQVSLRRCLTSVGSASSSTT